MGKTKSDDLTFFWRIGKYRNLEGWIETDGMMDDNKKFQRHPFEWIWTTDKDKFVLVRSRTRPGLFTIFNIRNRSNLIIEDDEVYLQVLQKMLDAGIRVVNVGDEPPP